FLHAQDPRRWNVAGPREGMKYFEPSLARTASGNFIPARTLMMDGYCQQCHKDNYDGWFHSAHHFGSFNNKPYLFSIRETREVVFHLPQGQHSAGAKQVEEIPAHADPLRHLPSERRFRTQRGHLFRSWPCEGELRLISHAGEALRRFRGELLQSDEPNDAICA